MKQEISHPHTETVFLRSLSKWNISPKNGNSDVALDVVPDTDTILKMLFFLSSLSL